MEVDIFRAVSLFIGYSRCRSRKGTRGWGSKRGYCLEWPLR